MRGNVGSLKRDLIIKIVKVWEVRKQKLYGDDTCTNQLQSQSSTGGLGVPLGLRGKGMVRKFREGKLYCVCYACRVTLLRVMCVLMYILWV